MQLIALPISLIPSLWCYFYLRNLKKEDKQYKENCWSMLKAGFISTFGVIALSMTFDIIGSLTGLKKLSPLIADAFKAIIVAGLAEELVKHYHVNKLIKENRETISLLETTAFAGIVGIGFEMIESVVYALGTNVIQILVRGITALHISYGLLMGYYIGKHILTGEKKYSLYAILIPLFMHGGYDFSLSDELMAVNDNFVFLPFIFTIGSLIVGIRLLKKLGKNRDNPEYIRPLMELGQKQPDNEENETL
ncbi:MAG: PrsW family intramembrane metalloprotease [Erysipelotrichaceae bacterium]|nr:PrsW family intramembrane metalloprotease [Erysipelotrichaceae bacterium]